MKEGKRGRLGEDFGCGRLDVGLAVGLNAWAEWVTGSKDI